MLWQIRSSHEQRPRRKTTTVHKTTRCQSAEARAKRKPAVLTSTCHRLGAWVVIPTHGDSRNSSSLQLFVLKPSGKYGFWRDHAVNTETLV